MLEYCFSGFWFDYNPDDVCNLSSILKDSENYFGSPNFDQLMNTTLYLSDDEDHIVRLSCFQNFKRHQRSLELDICNALRFSRLSWVFNAEFKAQRPTLAFLCQRLGTIIYPVRNMGI
ncbi:hypothetical protein AVEN_237807-1 [Araneus ventricosus]|uniref:Uncharacterized protein n=1 Tax=Araneus ventricosus TaxID=182803 RepID=A0A4Y2N6C9_ARAVE|nr:hypothetical protein AVEN_237807-1 [Araneus ventricosus]